VAVKIRLKRLGKIRTPQYRIVVMDSRTKRDGRAIEEIGKYHPKEDPSLIEVDSERALYWLGVGAQPTEQVHALLRVTGDWQKFKGEPGTEGTLRFKDAPRDKKADYEAALAAAQNASDDAGKGKATTSRKKAAAADDAKSADTKSADAKSADTKVADAKAADTKSADAKSADTKVADAKSADTKSADTKSADAKSADTKSADTKSADAKSADTKVADAHAAEEADAATADAAASAKS